MRDDADKSFSPRDGFNVNPLEEDGVRRRQVQGGGGLECNSVRIFIAILIVSVISTPLFVRLVDCVQLNEKRADRANNRPTKATVREAASPFSCQPGG